MTWTPPARTPPRTYILRLSAQDSAGNTRAYGPDSPFVERFPRAPVVRVLGIDASLPRPSYAPGQSALLRIATDAASLTMQVFSESARGEADLPPQRAERPPGESACAARVAAAHGPPGRRPVPGRGVADRPLLRATRGA